MKKGRNCYTIQINDITVLDKLLKNKFHMNMKKETLFLRNCYHVSNLLPLAFQRQRRKRYIFMHGCKFCSHVNTFKFHRV